MPLPQLELIQAHGPEHVATARELFREYQATIGVDLEYQGFASELAALPEPYTPPGGALLIAHAGSEIAGCVGLRPIDSHTGEMKRLYVRTAYRGTGLGKRLVHAILETAQNAGYGELRLDTLASMTAAQALYQRLGFREIPPYNRAHLAGTRFYSLKLPS